jgi:small subunit ribosomal protein S6
MGTYEVLFIVSPDVPEGDLTSFVTDFRGIAEEKGAKLLEEDAWGRRRLAYPIGKVQDGIYHLFVFEAEAGGLSELDRRMKNSDKIMRHMIVRTDLEMRRAKKLGAIREEKEAAKASRPGAAGTEQAAAQAAPASAAEAPAQAAPAETAPAPAEEPAPAETAPATEPPATGNRQPATEPPATTEEAPAQAASATTEEAPAEEAAVASPDQAPAAEEKE